MRAFSNSRTQASTGHASRSQIASTVMSGNSRETSGSISLTTIRVWSSRLPSNADPSSAVGTMVPGHSCPARTMARSIFSSSSIVRP